MEYPWQHHHHHPPPPLYPPPLQPPPPPPPPQQHLNPSPFSLSHNHYPNPQFHHHYPNSQSHIPNPIFQSHHQFPNSQSHGPHPTFQSHDHCPSFQSLNRDPSFQPDQHPSLNDQHPTLPLHHRYPPSFQSLPDRDPCFDFLNDQNPSLRFHGQNPSFDFLHDQRPSFEFLHDYRPSFEFLHDQRPSLRSHDQRPSFELLHDQPPSFQSHGQDPRFNLLDKNPSFRSPAAYPLQNPRIADDRNPGDAYSPFDHGYKRPRPDELGINERRLKLIHDHGGNDPMLPNGGDFREDLGLKRPRFEESDVRKNHYKVSEFQDTGFTAFHAENEFNRPSLEANFRSNFECKQGRSDLFPPNLDIRSNGFNVSPPTLQVSPQNRTISGNRSVFTDPKGPLFPDKFAPSLQEKPSSLFPISVTAAASSYSSFPEVEKSSQPYFQENSRIRASNGFPAEEFQPIGHRLSTDYPREGRHFPFIPSSKPKSLDASRIFKQPHRATRPDHIVVILRGLPGSGKSYLAKIMRDLEVENGGTAPRIHSMDDYFMTEVEKVEESDNLKSSGASRRKKPVVKMVTKYCYEAEMEEAYRSSMLKTFKKTLDEGAFPFVIVDDRNLRVADFAQFWAIAKRSGYEVYLLEATYKDPAGCAARNVHDFTLEDIQKMAGQWEEAPSMYLKLDAKSLLQGDDLKENAIQEVDMDTDDGESEDAQNGLAERYSNTLALAVENLLPSGRSKAVENLNAERDHLREEVKDLGKSKWSNDLEDDDGKKAEFNKGDNANAFSAIVKVYKKEGKSVHWGDKAANTGFSIGAAKRVNTTLEIGPGSGYNSKSNPLSEELGFSGNNGKSKTQSVFQERIRAERESTQAVFDRRRHRIGGLDSDEE